MRKRISDEELISKLKIDKETLKLFKDVQKKTILEVKKLESKTSKKFNVLGISGSGRDKLDMAQEGSNSEFLLKVCLDECRLLGAKTELIPLRKYDIKYCKACYSTTNTQCHYPCSCYAKGTSLEDDMSKTLYDKILKADVIIFAAPVNNFSMSTLMKSFIDRCISLDGSLSPANPKSTKDKELNKKHMKFIELTADNEIVGSGMLKRFAGKVAGIIVTGHEEGASMVISSLFMTLNHYGMIFPPFSNVYSMSSVCNSTYEDKKIVTGNCSIDWVKKLSQNLITMAKLVKKTKQSSWKYEYDEN